MSVVMLAPKTISPAIRRRAISATAARASASTPRRPIDVSNGPPRLALARVVVAGDRLEHRAVHLGAAGVVEVDATRNQGRETCARIGAESRDVAGLRRSDQSTMSGMRLAILGGGPAGYAAAATAAHLGADVTLIEENQLGGNCTMTDAIPSKTLLTTADAMLKIAPRRGRRARLRARPPRGEPAAHAGPGAGGRAAPEPGRARADGRHERAGAARAGLGDRSQHADRAGRRAATTRSEFDALLVCTGASPFVPPFAHPDGRRRADHASGVRAARPARAPGRAGRRPDRLRVRRLLLPLRLAGDADLGPRPAAAQRRPRSGRGAGGGVPASRGMDVVKNGRAAAIELRRGRRGAADAGGRPRDRAARTCCCASACAPTPAGWAWSRPGSSSASEARCRSTSTAAPTSPTSTPAVTSPARSCWPTPPRCTVARPPWMPLGGAGRRDQLHRRGVVRVHPARDRQGGHVANVRRGWTGRRCRSPSI